VKAAPPPLCNCPAPVARYGKTFPHRAGKVRGCHMGPDGQAKDGIARPGCTCRACELTNTVNDWAGFGRQDNREETRDPLHAQRTPAEWRREAAAHEELNAGLYGPPTLNEAGQASQG
jgi:hypothetical protein